MALSPQDIYEPTPEQRRASEEQARRHGIDINVKDDRDLTVLKNRAKAEDESQGKSR